VTPLAGAPQQRPRPGRREPPGPGGFAVSTPAPAQAWREVLTRARRALPTQTPAWLGCVCAVDGYEDASRLYQTADGRRLVLPLVRRRAVPPLAVRAGLPVGWGPGGLLSDDGPVRPEDVRMVVEDLARRRSLRTLLRPDPAAAAVWEAGMPSGVRRKPCMTQTVPLDGGFDRVWRTRFRPDTRTRVRRAERAGVVVERDDTGRLVPVFHELYASSVARWAGRDGRPLALARWQAARREPERKLRTVAAALGAGCRIYAAFHAGQPVAAIVVLFGSGTAAYWRGAMRSELAGPTCANYLLHRTAIEDAAQAGCTCYLMGESDPGSPLALFKSRFGAVSQHLASYRIEPVPLGALASRARSGVRQLLQLRPGRG